MVFFLNGQLWFHAKQTWQELKTRQPDALPSSSSPSPLSASRLASPILPSTSFITHHSHPDALTRSCGFSLAWIRLSWEGGTPLTSRNVFKPHGILIFSVTFRILPRNGQLNWITRTHFPVPKGWTLGINFQLDRLDTAKEDKVESEGRSVW